MDVLKVLKDMQPFCGEWFIQSYVRREHGVDIYTVKNRLGFPANMNVAVLPEGKSGDDLLHVWDCVKSIGEEGANVVRILGTGRTKTTEDRELLFCKTESAETLKMRSNVTSITSGDIIKIAENVAGALCKCEEKGICHGCISPDNIYCVSGEYRLGNFEIIPLAKMLEAPIGKIYYGAPETLRKGECSIKSDMYSLGLIVYKMYNFDRLPFMPSKNEKYKVSPEDNDNAYRKRLECTEEFPRPIYAENEVCRLINKCCAYDPEDRYSSCAELAKAVRALKQDLDMTRSIDYPNFSAKGNDYVQQITSADDETEMMSHVSDDKSLNSGKEGESSDSEDAYSYTMGAQAYYTEAMSRIRNNRHVEVDESVLNNIEKTEKRLAEKYGTDSKQYKKFIEKLKSYESLQDSVEQLKRDNKKRMLIIRILVAAAIVAVIAGVVLMFNTNTYYINQGQHYNIYRRNLFGRVEQFKDVHCKELIKNGGRLYYISSDDGKLYSTSAKNGADEQLILDDAIATFKIENNQIYYINISEGGKLYKAKLDGTDKECIFDEACIGMSKEKNNIRFVLESDPQAPKLYNTKDGTIRDEIID